MRWNKFFALTLGLIVLGTFISLLLTGFFFGFEELAPIFTAFHLISYLYVIVFFILFFLVEKIFWRSLPASIKRIYENKKDRFRIIVLISFALFVLGIWVVNHYVFDYLLTPLSILGDVVLLLFALFLALLLLRPSRGRYVILYSSGFVLIVSVLLSLSMGNQKSSSSMEALKSLPYARWIPAGNSIKKIGVTLYNPDKSFKGINIYSSRNLSTVYLLDMEGDILHTWTPRVDSKKAYEWPYVKLLKNGDLLEIARKKMLICMDWNSNTKWIKKISSHHDIDIAENGDIYTLTHNYEVILRSSIPLPIGNEYLTILSPEGVIKKSISLYKIMQDKISNDRFMRIVWWLLSPKALATRIERAIKPPRDVFARPTDIFHSNTISIIKKDINRIIKRGRVLYGSMRLDLIGIIDLEEEKLIWSWGKSDLQGPHHPTPLENGNILIYDNGTRRDFTRILELNPLTEEIEWQYVGNPPQSFFSKWGGASQRLPNGNTLITESDRGRVFEITADGEIVWEFYNPEIDEKGQTRATIYRMMRITDVDNYACLKKLR